MNVSTLEAFAALLRGLETSEQEAALFLRGKVSIVDGNDDVVGELMLNGTVEHELRTA